MGAPDPDTHLSYLIAKVSHQLQVAIDRSLAGQGITLTQFSAMAHIAKSPGPSGADLARALLTTPQATATLLRRLVDAGLVERADTGPGVASAIRLTPLGLRRLRSAEVVATRSEDQALSALSAAKRRSLMQMLELLARQPD